MKKYFVPLIIVLITTASFRLQHFNGRGKITGSGGAMFAKSDAYFSRAEDTIAIKAMIDSGTDHARTFVLGVAANKAGSYSMNNFAANPAGNYTTGAICYYIYTNTNTEGTLIAHEFFVESGSVTVTNLSAGNISGTYVGNFVDANHNNDAPITIKGTFNGKF